MMQVNIHEAKTNLSMLVDKAAKGEEFIIAKAGKPMVKVIPFATEEKPKRRGGFLAEHNFSVPDDFDTLGAEEITRMFEGLGAE